MTDQSPESSVADSTDDAVPADGADDEVESVESDDTGGGDSPPATGLDEPEGATLEDVIAQNPAAVATFVDRLDLVNDLLDVLELGSSALEDDMVAELAGTGSTLLEAGDAMATDETVRLASAVGRNGDELAAALETLADLQRTGVLDDLVELADVLSLVSNALTDDMVAELAHAGSSLGEVADVAAEPDTVRGLQTLLRAVGEASDPDDPPEPIGPVGLVRATRDPDVKRGLGYLIALSRALGRGVES